MSIETIEQDAIADDTSKQVRLTEADRRRMYGPLKPFSVERWMASGPPGTPEQIAEMEELLRLREEERQESLAREAGLDP